MPFKTRRCKFFPRCKHGIKCKFAHSLAELRNFPQQCHFGPECRHGTRCRFVHPTITPIPDSPPIPDSLPNCPKCLGIFHWSTVCPHNVESDTANNIDVESDNIDVESDEVTRAFNSLYLVRVSQFLLKFCLPSKDRE
jgi:hypothetical protein